MAARHEAMRKALGSDDEEDEDEDEDDGPPPGVPFIDDEAERANTVASARRWTSTRLMTVVRLGAELRTNRGVEECIRRTMRLPGR